LLLLFAAPAATADECVIVLHGLLRTSASMETMAEAIEEAGFTAINIDYPSREYPIEMLAPMAIGKGLVLCESAGAIDKIHFVTHSLGGILVRNYLSDHDIPRIGRVVMLGPPNQGSAAVDELGEMPGVEWVNGPAGRQLGKGDESVPLGLGPAEFELGIIAGNRSIDPITSAVLDDPDDGKVSVADTILEGMNDFVVVEHSHAFMMRMQKPIELTIRFLQTGSFTDPQQAKRVRMATSLGVIELELYPDKAPVTVENFLRLVDGAHLDGGTFYRVVSPDNDNGSPVISVIQGGIGDAEGPFPPIAHETTMDTGLLHLDGSISMARAEVGTATTEFFICVGYQPALDFAASRNADGQGFAAFGRVIKGMDVVRAIHESPADAATDDAYVQGQILEEPVVISKIRRTR
jgi:cyclophilin family peptidyl-prolyl cis-trans isomerase/pimeloyl-ACP methyl ester carboxylesterase